MKSLIRLLDKRSHDALIRHPRAPHAAVLTLVLMLSPGLVGQTRAADIDTPVVSKGYIATDASEICTFWDGLGTERPFVLTDNYDRPVSWKNWIDAVNDDTYNRFFDGLDGLIFLASPTGQEWFRSPAGQAWAHSPRGREWINEFVKGAPADRSNGAVEYVRVCDSVGSGYFYIPGTETCLKIGGYVRSDVGINDYDSLRSALQPTTATGFTPEQLQDLARAFSAALDTPSSTPQPNANQPGSNPAGRTQVETTQDDSGWSGKIRVQRDFGGGSGGLPPSQTSQQNGNASGANGTTTPAGASTQVGTPSDGTVTFRIFVKGMVPEGSPPGPAIPGQFVSLVGGKVEPDLPANGTTRTAEQENMGADKGAPLGKSDQNGVAEFRVDYGDIKYLMGNSYLRDALTLKANYTLNGSIDVQKHGGFVAPAPDNTPAPDFTKGSLDGVSYRWNEFSVGTQKFWEGGYSVDYNVNVTPEQVRQDIIETLRDELGPDIVVTFDGNVCRIELPARVTAPYSPVPQKSTAGIPEATIRLSLAQRRDGGAP